MVAKKQFKVTLPTELIDKIDYYKNYKKISQSQFIENAVQNYIGNINSDYRGNDLVIQRLNQLIEEQKATQKLLEESIKISTAGFDTLFNLTDE